METTCRPARSTMRPAILCTSAIRFAIREIRPTLNSAHSALLRVYAAGPKTRRAHRSARYGVLYRQAVSESLSQPDFRGRTRLLEPQQKIGLPLDAAALGRQQSAERRAFRQVLVRQRQRRRVGPPGGHRAAARWLMLVPTIMPMPFIALLTPENDQ